MGMCQPKKKAKKNPTKTYRGARSVELACALEQQFKLLYKAPLTAIGSKTNWPRRLGSPLVRGEMHPTPWQVPNTITIVSDQGSDIIMRQQLLLKAGARVVPLYDHNHRDDNDSKKIPSIVKFSIEMLEKLSTGPYRSGQWYKSIQESSAKLLECPAVLAE